MSKSSRTHWTLYLTVLSAIGILSPLASRAVGQDYFGILLGLPPTYYLGLSSLTIAAGISWFERCKRTSLWISQLVLLFVALFIVPLMIVGTPIADHSYDFLAPSLEIVRTGRIPSVFWVPSYPLAWVLYSQLIALTGLGNATANIDFWSILWQLLFAIFVLSIARLLSGSNRTSVIATWLFLLADWLNLAYVSDQSAGFALFLVFLVIILVGMNGMDKRGVLLLAICFVGILGTHAPSAIYGLFSLVLLAAYLKKLRSFLPIALVLLLTWELYFAYGFVATDYAATMGHLLSFGSLFRNAFVARLTYANPAHSLATRVELIDAGLIALAGLAGLFWAFRNTERHRLPRESLIVSTTVLIAAVLTSFLIATTLGLEIFQRTMLFTLAPLAFFASLHFTRSRKLGALLVLLMILMGPANIIGQYNSLPRDQVSSANLQAIVVFDSYATSGLVCGGVFPGLGTGGLFPLKGSLSFQVEYDNMTRCLTPDTLVVNVPTYVTITPLDEGYYSLDVGNITVLSSIESVLRGPLFDMTYASNGVNFYISD